MSSQASKAELHRMLNGEKELEVNHGFAPATPPSSTDIAFFEHIGAHFGSEKESCPSYPTCVEVGDEAAGQPDAVYTYQLKHSPSRGRPHNLPPKPTHTPTQKDAYLSPIQYKEFNLQLLAKLTRGGRSNCSGAKHQSSPTPTREASPSTTASHADPTDKRFLEHDHVPEYFFGAYTPSYRSFASDSNETHRDGMGPLPPLPHSQYHPYNTVHNSNGNWAPADEWNERAVGEDLGQLGYFKRVA